jgi:hypothetical protein
VQQIGSLVSASSLSAVLSHSSIIM